MLNNIVSGLVVLIVGTWLIKKIWPKSKPKEVTLPIEPDPEITLSSYKNNPYNCVEMRNTGVEPIKNLHVELVYRNNDGEEGQTTVEDFFEENDPKMIWKQFKATALKKMEVVRFRLRQSKSVVDGKITVVATFIGVKTKKVAEVRKEFELKL